MKNRGRWRGGGETARRGGGRRRGVVGEGGDGSVLFLLRNYLPKDIEQSYIVVIWLLEQGKCGKKRGKE